MKTHIHEFIERAIDIDVHHNLQGKISCGMASIWRKMHHYDGAIRWSCFAFTRTINELGEDLSARL